MSKGNLLDSCGWVTLLNYWVISKYNPTLTEASGNALVSFSEVGVTSLFSAKESARAILPF